MPTETTTRLKPHGAFDVTLGCANDDDTRGLVTIHAHDSAAPGVTLTNEELDHLVQWWGAVRPVASLGSILADAIPLAEVLDEMATYGGSFVKALAEAWRRADLHNAAKLRIIFAGYYEDYETALRGRTERLPAGAGPAAGPAPEKGSVAWCRDTVLAAMPEQGWVSKAQVLEALPAGEMTEHQLQATLRNLEDIGDVLRVPGVGRTPVTYRRIDPRPSAD